MPYQHQKALEIGMSQDQKDHSWLSLATIHPRTWIFTYQRSWSNSRSASGVHLWRKVRFKASKIVEIVSDQSFETWSKAVIELKKEKKINRNHDGDNLVKETKKMQYGYNGYLEISKEISKGIIKIRTNGDQSNKTWKLGIKFLTINLIKVEHRSTNLNSRHNKRTGKDPPLQRMIISTIFTNNNLT